MRSGRGTVLLGLAALVAVLGVGACAPGTSSEVRVGVILPLTGKNAHYGHSVKRGLVLALADELRKPDSAGPMVRLVYRDSRTDPTLGLRAMRELIDEHAVPAVVTVSSGVTIACATLANESRTVLISPTASAPEISFLGDWVYRNTSSDVLEGITMAQYCVQNGLDPVAVAYIDNAYGRGLAQIFEKHYREKGGKLLDVVAFAPEQRDFGPLIARLKKSRPRAVYLAGYYAEMLAFLLQARDLKLDAQLLCPASFYVNDILKEAGAAAEGVIFTQPSYDPSGQDEPVRSFVAAFRARYGETPDIFSASAYDVGKILIAAVRVGGDSAEAVKKTLDSMEGFVGVTGETTFDKNGDVSRVPHISTVKDGAFVRIR